MSYYEYPSLRQRIDILIDQVKSTLLLPLRVATSKIAIRTYLTSALLFLTSLFLFGLAITAYTAFYWSYVPRIGFSREVHLQFENRQLVTSTSTANDFFTTPTADAAGNANPAMPQEIARQHITSPAYPWGSVKLAPDFASQQIYDITVHLTLPRTPHNIAQGNFMLDASLLGLAQPGSSVPGISALVGSELPVLAHSRRSAILTYYSREIDLAKKVMYLPGYLTGLYHETETLDIQLFEGIQFPRGYRNVPQTLRLEIHSRDRDMQLYSCHVSFRARFRGLRWIMYNHRVVSAVVFISAFWITEVVAMGLAWILLSIFIFPSVDKTAIKSETSGAQAIKQEDEDDLDTGDEATAFAKLSDTERTYPSYGGGPLLRYESSEAERKFKREEDSMEPFPSLVQTEAADDEEEQDDFVLDSGLGTSLESSAGSRRESGLKRRKSGRGRAGS